MSKFKVGDKVRLIGGIFTAPCVNKTGTITLIESEGEYNYYEINDIDDYKYPQNCYDGDIEHTRIKNTKIARKLNPDYKVEGKWLIMN